MKRKILALILCILMVFGCVSITAADEGEDFGIIEEENADDFYLADQNNPQDDVLIFAPEEEGETLPAPSSATKTSVPEEETMTVKAAEAAAAPVLVSAAQTAISSVTLKKSSVVYTGKAQKNTITVKAKVNGKTKTLKSGTDYTVTYKNNVNVGTATVIVKGKGSYKGTIKKTFKITAVALASVTLKSTSLVYTGKAQKNTLTVKAKVNGKTKTLKSGTDYTASYTNNTNVGTATVTVKGKGNYKGTIKKTFKITAAAISSAKLKYTTMAYTGTARTQSKTVTVKAKVNGKTVTLTYGTDYSVSYTNNVDIGQATVTIKGKGNFKGTIKKNFLIVRKAAEFVDPVSEWSVYDDLIDQIRVESDKGKRAELMYQAEDILMATNAVIPLYFYNDLYLQKSDVSGIYTTPYANKYFQYAQTEIGTDTLHICLASEPYTLDPALNSSVDGACYLVNSFAGLYTYGPSGTPEPDCADFYSVSEDGKIYTVTLKEELKWSDGSDLTAHDFEYSWKRASDPATGADYGYLFEIFEGYGSEDGINVTAIDDRTLEFVLTAPCGYMEDLMAFPTFFPVQKAWVESYSGEDADAWCKEAPFPSNGAFMCIGWGHWFYDTETDTEQTGTLIYAKNPNYWNAENVRIEKLEFLLSENITTIYDAYKAGELDFIDSVPSDEAAAMIASQDPELHSVDELGTYYIAFNVKSPLFDGKTPEQAAAMREAVSLLIDRAYIVDTFGRTGQTIATTYIPVGMSDGNGGVFHASNLDGYYDPYSINNDMAGTLEKAIQLLKSAGFKFTENDILSEETPFEFKYATNSGGHVAIAESIKADLAVLGIKMTVDQMDWSTFLEKRKAGEFDLAREGWIADFNDPINMLEMFTTESGNNDPQFGR